MCINSVVEFEHIAVVSIPFLYTKYYCTTMYMDVLNTFNIQLNILINPRHACAASITIVAVCVCVCVCHISPLGFLFVVKTMPRTQWAMKVKNFVAFSLKLLHCRDLASTPSLDDHTFGRPFFLQRTYMCIMHKLILEFFQQGPFMM